MSQTPRIGTLHPSRVELLHPRVVDVLRRMTPQQRIQAASDMHENARTMVVSHLRSLHPDWDEDRISAEVRRRLLGEAN
ncbi:hypothetical protein SH661x_000351 [Planctomicrobium sp. SH661]|uniref:hypothetical protein n=1 Tax=Planctomicrobium sp. SH661 TaxID=3448124 RepID=UPI003F5B7E43